MKLSAVLALYNGFPYLSEQLLSIAQQSRRLDSLVIADDGSDDGSLQLARRVISDLQASGLLPEDVRYLERSAAVGPLGSAQNFARALEASSGDLIALSDQDDIWFADRLERQVAEFQRHPETLMVFSDALLVAAEGQPLSGALFDTVGFDPAAQARVNAGQALPLLLRRNVVTGATAMVHRRLLKLALPIPPGWLHDEWLAVVAADRRALRVVAQPVIRYRQHGTNQVGARLLTLTDRIHRCFEPGRERNRRLLLRVESWAERSDSFSSDTAVAVAEKLEQERHRSGLSPIRLARVLPVLRRRRNYRRFGNGWQDQLRDLLQPLR